MFSSGLAQNDRRQVHFSIIGSCSPITKVTDGEQEPWAPGTKETRSDVHCNTPDSTLGVMRYEVTENQSTGYRMG